MSRFRKRPNEVLFVRTGKGRGRVFFLLLRIKHLIITHCHRLSHILQLLSWSEVHAETADSVSISIVERLSADSVELELERAEVAYAHSVAELHIVSNSVHESSDDRESLSLVTPSACAISATSLSSPRVP